MGLVMLKCSILFRKPNPFKDIVLYPMLKPVGVRVARNLKVTCEACNLKRLEVAYFLLCRLVLRHNEDVLYVMYSVAQSGRPANKSQGKTGLL